MMKAYRMLLGPIEQQLSNKAIDMRRSELRTLTVSVAAPHVKDSLWPVRKSRRPPKYAVS